MSLPFTYFPDAVLAVFALLALFFISISLGKKLRAYRLAQKKKPQEEEDYYPGAL